MKQEATSECVLWNTRIFFSYLSVFYFLFFSFLVVSQATIALYRLNTLVVPFSIVSYDMWFQFMARVHVSKCGEA